MELRKYQFDAIRNLHERTENIARPDRTTTCVLQAPTGSGKTVMMAKFLQELVHDRNIRNMSFIWISVRKLHGQSKDKLEKIYSDDGAIECSYYDDLDGNAIEENEILFLNWDSINKFGKNILMKENEQGNTLVDIIKNTKIEGRSIVLIIDESHHTASSDISTDLINIISPRAIFMISATPQYIEGQHERVNVDLNDVKDDGMIKKEVIINPLFGKLSITGNTVTATVIEQALKKRKELESMYREENSDIVPLVLIQLPDRRTRDNDIREKVEKILDSHGINEENGKLAIWLSDDKSETLEDIEENNNSVEVLIFKQAISLGWDCPRASILVALRELTDYSFTIQTVGRIMRMPERRHYLEHDDLNCGYVFTNLETINVEQSMEDYVGQYHAKRNDEYKTVWIHSAYASSSGISPVIGSGFNEIFRRHADEMKLRSMIDADQKQLTKPIIINGSIRNPDRIGSVEHQTTDIEMSDVEVQNLIEERVAEWCMGFAVNGSSGVIRTAIYNFLTDEFGIKEHSRHAQEIVLNVDNFQHFTACVVLAKKEYDKKRNMTSSVKNMMWKVPEMDSYGGSYTERDIKKSIMKPLYIRNGTTEIEIDFMRMLAASDKVIWWYKNGDSGKKYFAVKYNEDETSRLFYVDFIIKFNDGRIGLFDTKSGMTAQLAGSRAAGLHSYIRKESGDMNKLIGGIVIRRERAWFYHDGAEYSYSDTDLAGWKPLDMF